ncbi:Magnesium transporter MRS2-F [Acorus gramineus]|uniref:Magnesium transporter n=1 Tax=Acorus gramineus TaxID=55184 RepID=A0AAV9AIH5_ACOGR|nr:Magnesium transporter MRS2-F [Acorus gramineus]
MRSPTTTPPPFNPTVAAAATAGGSVGGGGRHRKGPASRAWLVVSESGRSYLEEVGKHSIMRRTGLPARDLRVLDPMLSYPSTILGRERAIVMNLEHVKAIITATEVLVTNPKDPLVVPFVRDLQSRIGAPQQVADGSDVDMEAMAQATWGSPISCAENGCAKTDIEVDQLSNDMDHEMQEGSPGPTLDLPKPGSTKVLPFEFRALEVCLESACRCLESETLTLEQEAYPALDELTSKISTLNLERVRQIKSRLVAISGRVQKVRDELEHLLDDDMDMAEMYLTEKLGCQPVDGTSSRIELDDELEVEQRDQESKVETESNNGTYIDFKPNTEELEMLLEAYFVQIDGTLNKLSTMREYVDDTEDYINIMLDEKQNQLLEMGVMLSTATLVFSAGIVVVGIFGMNIGISLYNGSGSTQFWETTLGTLGGCVVLYIIAIGWGKKSGLLP